MGNAIAATIPFMLGAAAVPVFLIVVLLLLRGEAGVTTAAAFVGGVTFTRLVQGALFAFVLPGSGDGNDDPRTVVAVLLLVIGLLLLTTAARKLLTDEDPDAPPPKWMSAFSAVSPLKAFLMGAAWIAIAVKMWAFTLGAIGAIREADPGTAGGVVAYLVYVLGAQLLGIVPIALSVAAPERAEVVLGNVAALLERYNKPIMIAVSLIFGVYFLLNGVAKLRG